MKVWKMLPEADLPDAWQASLLGILCQCKKKIFFSVICVSLNVITVLLAEHG